MVAYKPTLAQLSARNSHYNIGERRCGGCEPPSAVVDELWLAARIYSYCCCCEPEFDPAQLESRHDALDSPSTLGIRVTSPLAWGRNRVRELFAQRRYVLGDGGGGPIITASPFPSYEYDRRTCCGIQRQQYCCCIIPSGMNTTFIHTKKTMPVGSTPLAARRPTLSSSCSASPVSYPLGISLPPLLYASR